MINKDLLLGFTTGTSLGLIAGVLLTAFTHTAPPAPAPPPPDPLGSALGAAAGALVQGLMSR